MADLRVVLVAWHIDETRDKAAVRVASYEQLDALALLQAQNAAADARQVFDVGLKQLVARKSLEYVHQRLAGVTVVRQPRAVEHLLHFETQQRNVTRAARIGYRREQTEKAQLACDTTFVVVSLDADVVEIGGAMHGRLRIGFRDDQQIG